MPNSSANTTVVLRPNWGAYRRWFGAPALGLGTLAVIVLAATLRAHRGVAGVLVPVGLLLGVVLVCLGYLVIMMRTSAISLGAGRIEYRHGLVRRTVLTTDQELVGQLAQFKGPALGGGRVSHVLVLRSRSGGSRIWLDSAYWAHENLEQIAAFAGVPVTRKAMSARAYEDAAPGSMPFRALRPVVFGVGVGVLVICVVVLGSWAGFKAAGIPPFDDRPPKAVAQGTVNDQDAVILDLKGVIGGKWEPTKTELVACQDDDNYKGWRREVSTRLQVDDRDDIVTPKKVTPSIAAALNDKLVARGYPALDGDIDSDGAELTAYPDHKSSVEVVFAGGGAQLMVSSTCEVPGR
jgi:hypothetical protein